MFDTEIFAGFLNEYCETSGISMDEVFDTLCCEDNLRKIGKLLSDGSSQKAADELSGAEKVHHELKDGEFIFARKQLYEKLSRKHDFVISLISRFDSGHENDCENICSLAQSGDYMGARSIIHDILGLSGNLCFQRLYTAAGKLRRQCIAENVYDLTDFRRAWEETVFIVKLYLRLYRKNDNDGASRGSVDFPKLRSEFIGLCGEYDIRAAEFFEEHKGDFREALSEEDFKKIETAVYRYDFGFITENLKQ